MVAVTARGQLTHPPSRHVCLVLGDVGDAHIDKELGSPEKVGVYVGDAFREGVFLAFGQGADVFDLVCRHIVACSIIQESMT